MKRGLISTVVLTIALTGTAAAQQATPEALRPGDAIQLQLVIPGDAGAGQDYSGDYMIAESGTVALPLIGEVQARGVPAQQLRSRIIEGYQSLFRNQAVQVTLLRRISVLGAIRNPGLYHADPTMHIGDVIAMAGGATEAGRSDEVQIIRNGQKITTDISSSSALPTELRSGDQLYVPEKSWFSRNGAWLVGFTVGIVGVIVRAVY